MDWLEARPIKHDNLLETHEMDIERIKHIMNSLMILSLLIFGGLVGIIMITNVQLSNTTISLPFAFLFIFIITFITTGQINDRPKLTGKYLRDWLIICTIGIIISALAFTFY
ncbi:MAG: hypothetical protein E3J86_07940 [Candidatus Thorarchaeota archaeon]|nr:MAG: hypothetical protein E3J86_07940 [Candidatus Thorarchaeota archaeon]